MLHQLAFGALHAVHLRPADKLRAKPMTDNVAIHEKTTIQNMTIHASENTIMRMARAIAAATSSTMFVPIATALRAKCETRPPRSATRSAERGAALAAVASCSGILAQYLTATRGRRSTTARCAWLGRPRSSWRRSQRSDGVADRSSRFEIPWSRHVRS